MGERPPPTHLRGSESVTAPLAEFSSPEPPPAWEAGSQDSKQVNQDAANRATTQQVDAQPNGPESTPWDSRATAPPPALADIH